MASLLPASYKEVFAFALMLSVAFGYMFWLDSGCDMNGVMTWEGKVCVNY